MKVNLTTVTLDVKGETTEFVEWGSFWKQEDLAVYSLLIPKDLYLELLRATVIDEVNLFNSLLLYVVINDTYRLLSDSKKKEEVYFAIINGTKKGKGA